MSAEAKARFSPSERATYILRLIIAVTLPLCAMALSMVFMGVRYRINDESMLCAIAAGALGDRIHLIFSNVVIGLLCGALNSIYCANWYLILELIMIALSLCALCHTLLRRFGIVSGTAFTALLLASFSVYTYYFVEFTVSAFVAVSCGLLLIVEHLGEKNSGIVIGILLALLGSLYRFNCFLAAGALSAAMLLYRFFHLERKKKLVAVLTMMILFALIFGFWLLDKAAYSNEKWQIYTEYNVARARYSDYASLILGAENPFAVQGISDVDYAMLRNWNFYDPARFTPELLYSLSDAASTMSSVFSAENYIQLLKQFFTTNSQHGLMAVFALLLTVVFFRPKKGFLVSLVTALLFLLLLFILQLQYGGRITPWLQVGLLFSLSSYLIYNLPELSQKLSRFAVLPLLLCVFLVCGAWQDYIDYHLYTSLAIQNHNDNHAYIAQMSEDDENLYLLSAASSEFAMCADVWNPTGEGFFNNIVFMGGWTNYHPDCIATLERFGITRPIVDSVNNPNVYFDYHDIDAVAAYASQEMGCEVLAVKTGQNVYCPYQLVTAENAE